MSNLQTEKLCLTCRRNIGTCVSNVNVLSCSKFAENVDPLFRELRRAMCNVGRPDAVMCRPSAAMLARMKRL
jgi:hypothetical protein